MSAGTVVRFPQSPKGEAKKQSSGATRPVWNLEFERAVEALRSMNVESLQLATIMLRAMVRGGM